MVVSTIDPSTAFRAGEGNPTVRLRAQNVLGTKDLEIDVPRGLATEEVARSLAGLMTLDTQIPWALRDDSTSAYLDDARPIGEQVDPRGGTTLVLTPKTHLG